MGGQRILLGAEDEVLWAIADRCSHADCAFSSDGEIDGLTAICDCHGSEFDVVTGEALTPPADEPIVTYRIRLVAGRIEIDLP